MSTSESPPAIDVLDDRLLRAAEGVVAEHLGEDAAGGGGRGGRRGQGRFGGVHRRRRSYVRARATGRPAAEGVPARGCRAGPATDNRANPPERNGARHGIGQQGHHRRQPRPRPRGSLHARTAAPRATSAIATSRSWKDKNSGEKVEETEWHRVVFNDKLAEIAGEYLKKGRSVYVEGPPEDAQVDRQGRRREVHAPRSSPATCRCSAAAKAWAAAPAARTAATAAAGGGGYERPAPAARPAAPRPSRPAAKSSTGFDNMDDDIPF